MRGEGGRATDRETCRGRQGEGQGRGEQEGKQQTVKAAERLSEGERGEGERGGGKGNRQ